MLFLASPAFGDVITQMRSEANEISGAAHVICYQGLQLIHGLIVESNAVCGRRRAGSVAW